MIVVGICFLVKSIKLRDVIFMLNVIIQSIIMCIIFIYIEKITKGLHDNKQVSLNETDTEYTVRLPLAFMKVYSLMCKFGIFLFLIFLVVKFIIHWTVDDGCFIFAIIFSGIGFIVAYYGWKWKILVNGEQIEIQRLFHKSKKIKINEIEKVVKETKTSGQMQINRLVL